MSGDLLAGKVVLVSGVGPGLGKETAATILREGGRAVIVDLVGDRLEQIRDELDPSGESTLAVRADITSDEDCAGLADEVEAAFGQLDGVVNVAAYDTAVGNLMSPTFLDDWDRSADVNVKGTLRLTRSVMPLVQRQGGSVILIASTAFARPRRTRLNGAYGMSKAALVTATYYLAEEFGPDNVRVNTIAPGWKMGPVVEDYFAQAAREQGVTVEELMEPILDELTLRRMATDADVANSVLFFLSDLAVSVTGQTLFVDGGHVFR